jgi:hypothetical protein
MSIKAEGFYRSGARLRKVASSETKVYGIKLSDSPETLKADHNRVSPGQPEPRHRGNGRFFGGISFSR